MITLVSDHALQNVITESWQSVWGLLFSCVFAWCKSAAASISLGDGPGLLFSVMECDPDACPGSAYNLVTAAWANIGYMTHSDFLSLVGETGFGSWAPLLYVMGAIGALISVALNNPPRNYTWFLLGPAIFNFLIFTTRDVTGVAWRVAGDYKPMAEVWRDAETGLGNTQLVQRLGIKVNKVDGPSSQYKVAYAMAFLDGLFSSTTNRIISWIGIGRQEGTGGADTDLAQKEGTGEGPWYIMANLKWGMLENIVGVNARDPDVRDALVTFLASECGDQFKKGVDSGAYSAASQARGASLPPQVLKKTQYEYNFLGFNLNFGSTYEKFAQGMDAEAVPTPRSIIRLFNQPKEAQGSFRQFSTKFEGDKADEKGRTVQIVCTEYLYVILQALRWESGHAYWQLVRSAPDGFTRTSMLKSLFYGWDIRQTPTSQWANDQELENFVQHLIFVYLLRNELLYAPQITETGQRFAPAEQTRSFSEAYVRQQGSRAKAAELYNWAVMMPHVQGILAYLVLIAYPFAVMLMVIPGYWKAFFTWVTFFAWVKTWDIGFAIVHTLERSVWAMIGNHSSMARVANMLIQTSQNVGGLQVGKAGDCQGEKLSELCAIPDVKEGSTLSMQNAWALLDKTLLLTGSADLDLSNGYYIYIMAALYFAVPAVTGQLVLGAKAGLGGLATQFISGSATDAGNAAKSGTIGEASNKISANQAAMTQSVIGKSHRQSGLALQQLENANASLDSEIMTGRSAGRSNALGQASSAQQYKSQSFGSNTKTASTIAGFGGSLLGIASGTGDGTGNGGLAGWLATSAGKGAQTMLAIKQNELDQSQYRAGARAAAFNANSNWDQSRSRLSGQGFQQYASKLASEADFTAQTAAWEARNDFATHMSGTAGVAGYNAGTLGQNQKPTDMTGMALTGQLGSNAQGAARYSGTGFVNNVHNSTGRNRASSGGFLVNQNWGDGYSFGQTLKEGFRVEKVLQNAENEVAPVFNPPPPPKKEN